MASTIAPPGQIAGKQIPGTTEATPEQKFGGPTDPARHTPVAGQSAGPYPWEHFPGEPHGPYGAESDLFGMDIMSMTPAHGELYQDPGGDQTPSGHVGPWPKGVPLGVDPAATAESDNQNAQIHGTNFGGSRAKTFAPAPDYGTYEEIYDVDAGTSIQDPNVPKQVMASVGGWGNTDRVQSMAVQNKYGLDSAHTHLRVQQAPIPGNHMWMQPGGRVTTQTIPGTASIPDGPNSPFYGQDSTQNFRTQGAVLETLPAPYTAPPEAATAQGYPGGGGDDYTPVEFF